MDDLDYCARALGEVSRTFVKPIEALRPELSRAVTCAYLLCRAADTIEDHPTLPLPLRDRLYLELTAVLEDGADAARLVSLYRPHALDGADHGLVLSLPRVLNVYRAQPASRRDRCTPWITEMIRGMQIYSHRPTGSDGLRAVLSMADLERYCYFVAGTVGQLLTELFVDVVDLSDARERVLRRNAEEFGLGLQLTNVLKDITDDRARAVSYVPRDLCLREGMAVSAIVREGNRAAAHRALAPIFDRAQRALDAALEYTLAIPAEERDVRLFCLLPIWMAARTLATARGNDAQLIPGVKVKISRAEVADLVADCHARCGEDAALRDRWASLNA